MIGKVSSDVRSCVTMQVWRTRTVDRSCLAVATARDGPEVLPCRLVGHERLTVRVWQLQPVMTSLGKARPRAEWFSMTYKFDSLANLRELGEEVGNEARGR